VRVTYHEKHDPGGWRHQQLLKPLAPLRKRQGKGEQPKHRSQPLTRLAPLCTVGPHGPLHRRKHVVRTMAADATTSRASRQEVTAEGMHVRPMYTRDDTTASTSRHGSTESQGSTPSTCGVRGSDKQVQCAMLAPVCTVLHVLL
jgi:hypothetical protein